jgi:calcineurin-like phosphoesterase family protein
MMIVWRRVGGVGGIALLICACGGSGVGPSPGPGPGHSLGVLVGAGDIGMCGSTGPESTARLLDDIDGTVFTAGDNAYFQGTAQQFRDCYDPSWGRHRSRTRPAPGNHEYESAGAAPYFAYFGANAGPPGLGYYSFSVGEWHVVSLNSSVSMSTGSAQQAWLRDDLASHNASCVAAIWHHPLFSIGPNGPMPETRELWRTLYEAGADVIINGHDHFYARFARQTPDGVADTSRGIRQFVVGTGGAELVGFPRAAPNVETRISAFGVLKLTLRPGTYDWQFIAANSSQSDSGSDVCR